MTENVFEQLDRLDLEMNELKLQMDELIKKDESLDAALYAIEIDKIYSCIINRPCFFYMKSIEPGNNLGTLLKCFNSASSFKHLYDKETLKKLNVIDLAILDITLYIFDNIEKKLSKPNI